MNPLETTLGCDSPACTREGVHIWVAVVDARYALVGNTRCTFRLCEPHDEWYRNSVPQHQATRVSVSV